MHQLSPQEAFPIVYVLADPNDTATYYVRSVMRNSATGAIIQISGANFVNLTDGGSRRFSKTIQAPNDSGGQGFWIDITTTVYTDSAYTTKSENYFEQLDKYLVQQRLTTAMGFGGGSLSRTDVADEHKFDLKELKKALKEVLDEFVFPKTDLSPVLQGLDLLDEDLGKVGQKIGDVGDSVEAIKIPELAPFAKTIIEALALKIIENKAKEFDTSEIISKIDKIPTEQLEHPDYGPEFEKIAENVETIKTKIESIPALPAQALEEFLSDPSDYAKGKDAKKTLVKRQKELRIQRLRA